MGGLWRSPSTRSSVPPMRKLLKGRGCPSPRNPPKKVTWELSSTSNSPPGLLRSRKLALRGCYRRKNTGGTTSHYHSLCKLSFVFLAVCYIGKEIHTFPSWGFHQSCNLGAEYLFFMFVPLPPPRLLVPNCLWQLTNI